MNNTSSNEADSKELYHDAFREVDGPRVNSVTDVDVKDMSRMGKDQQFNVGGFQLESKKAAANM